MMFLRVLMLLVICTATFSLSSCGETSYDYGFKISCEKFEENSSYSSELELEVGDKIKLELCSNQTTGFNWDYEFTAENIVKEVSHDYEEPGESVVGAPGVELWTFEAIEKGTTEIKMEYSQPWEGGTKTEWTYTVKVTVE